MPDAFIQFDASDLDRVAMSFGATRKEIDLALRKATIRTTRWLRTQVLRTSSNVVSVSQRNFRKRVFLRIDKKNHGSVWVGLNPINLSFLSPRQTRRGVRARSIFRQSAFIMPSGAVMKRKGKARLPIEKQALPIAEALEGILQNKVFNSNNVARVFMKEFESNLQWRINQ